MVDESGFHVGRAFSGHDIEDACPCPKEPCGLVSTVRALPDCPEHALGAAKTVRQVHRASECPSSATPKEA